MRGGGLWGGGVCSEGGLGRGGVSVSQVGRARLSTRCGQQTAARAWAGGSGADGGFGDTIAARRVLQYVHIYNATCKPRARSSDIHADRRPQTGV